MSALPQEEYGPGPAEYLIPREVFERIDHKRGTAAMQLVIVTEAMLFVVMFFGYFFLSGGDPYWLQEAPPHLHYALPMLGILLTSSFVLWLGERASKKKKFGLARLAIAGTVLLGLVFLVLTTYDYGEHLKDMTPQMNAYGSIFYTITSIHGVHVCAGILILLYVLILPKLEPEEEMPWRPLHNAGLYWHFVDTVWVFIIIFLYLIPNFR